jgi:proline iminopeptidase
MRFRIDAIGLVHILAAVAPVAFACAAGNASGKAPALPVQRSSGVVMVRGTPHPYFVEGTGTPCIVVGTSPQYAQMLSDRLKQHIRFIYVDFKQSWNAEGAGELDITIDTLVDEVDQVRRALGFARVCVIGHSAPGLVALVFAARHAEVTSRAILIAVPPLLGPALAQARTEFWDADASPERKAALARNKQRLPDSLLATLSPRDAFAMRYVRNGPVYFHDASYDFSWAWLGQRIATEFVQRFLKQEIDPRPRLGSNTVPILVILGRYDYAVPYYLWDGIEARVPRVTRVRLERSGHEPMLDEPAAFDDEIIRWLATTR